jgi:CRISPR-associated protein Csm2
MPKNYSGNPPRNNPNACPIAQVERRPQPPVQSQGQAEIHQPVEAIGQLVFSPPDPELFNKVARQRAELVADNRNFNKPSQIRKFYDELCMWETKVSQEPEKFNDYLPFILMLNAKSAYANGRKLVDANFVKLIGDCLKQVKDQNTLRICKLFFEAFLGFYKELRPSDK